MRRSLFGKGPAACLSRDSEKQAETVTGPICEESLGSGLGVYFARVAPGREAPGAEIDGVKGDAEEIGGDETKLSRTHANDADDCAVDGADDPALPEFLAEHNGAEDGQNAGDVIQTNGLE